MSAVCALLAIVLPAIVALPTKHQIAQVGTKDESTPRHYHVVYAGLFALAFMVVGSSIMAFFPTATITTINMSTDSESENEPTSTTGFQVPEWLKGSLLLALWIGPILGLFLLPTSSTIRNDNHQNQKAIHSSVRRKYRQAMEEAADHQQILPNEAMRLIPPPAITSVNDNDNLTEKQPMQVTQPPPIDKTLEAEDMDVCETPQPIADKNLFEMLTTLEAWLFLMTACILVGAGTMLTINMGQLVQSQEFGNHPPQQQSKIESSDTDTDDDETVSSSSASNNSTATTAACLAMFSVAQAMARVASGAVSEAALTWNTRIFGIRGIPRTAFLVLSCAFAVTGHTVLALASSHLLLFVFGIVLVVRTNSKTSRWRLGHAVLIFALVLLKPWTRSPIRAIFVSISSHQFTIITLPQTSGIFLWWIMALDGLDYWWFVWDRQSWCQLHVCRWIYLCCWYRVRCQVSDSICVWTTHCGRWIGVLWKRLLSVDPYHYCRPLSGILFCIHHTLVHDSKQLRQAIAKPRVWAWIDFGSFPPIKYRAISVGFGFGRKKKKQHLFVSLRTCWIILLISKHFVASSYTILLQ